jgi:hypothetical protein
MLLSELIIKLSEAEKAYNRAHAGNESSVCWFQWSKLCQDGLLETKTLDEFTKAIKIVITQAPFKSHYLSPMVFAHFIELVAMSK